MIVPSCKNTNILCVMCLIFLENFLGHTSVILQKPGEPAVEHYKYSSKTILILHRHFFNISWSLSKLVHVSTVEDHLYSSLQRSFTVLEWSTVVLCTSKIIHSKIGFIEVTFQLRHVSSRYNRLQLISEMSDEAVT
jgi:hypothetical protein